MLPPTCIAVAVAAGAAPSVVLVASGACAARWLLVLLLTFLDVYHLVPRSFHIAERIGVSKRKCHEAGR